MLFLPRLSIKHPKSALGLCLLLILIAAAGIPRLTLRTDGPALIPEGDPRILEDR
ncbi:MAG: hypothetical protein QNK37_37325 [Acidobacteriota bacterium]|nr:hypothetical protein [Acidobacteriota bacterium]